MFSASLQLSYLVRLLSPFAKLRGFLSYQSPLNPDYVHQQSQEVAVNVIWNIGGWFFALLSRHCGFVLVTFSVSLDIYFGIVSESWPSPW